MLNWFHVLMAEHLSHHNSCKMDMEVSAFNRFDAISLHRNSCKMEMEAKMDISALAFHSIIIGLSILLSAVCLATVEHDAPFGLRVGYLECEVVGEPIVRTDFERFQPRSVIFFMPESNERNAFEKARKRLPKTDYWILRHPAWTDALLNVVGKPPDIIYDPQLTQVCDIYLGIRAVTPAMSFGIKLSSDDDFTIITAPAAMPNYHYDLEFFWRARVPMRGERIIVRAIGKPVYLQYFKFVPYLRRKLRKWFATKHIVVCRQPGKHLAFPGVAQLPNGDICVVFREGIAHVCPYGRIMLTRSHDGGRTWEAPVCIYDSPSDDRDPAIVVLRDGRIAVTLNTWNSWMADPALRRKYAKETKRIIRDGERKYVGAKIIFSNDGGETWSDAYLTPVFNPHGIAIAPDGKLYYVGVKTSHGWRHVVIYRSSNGIEWERYVEVARFPTASKLLTEVSTFAGYFCEPYLCIMPNGRWIVTLREHMHGFI